MTIKDRTRHEISEAFDFFRFLIKHPKEIVRIKDGSEINILCKDVPQKFNMDYRKKRALPTTNYLSEHTFHRV